MVLEYFKSELHLSVVEIDKLSGYREDKWTWPMKGLLTLSQFGLNVKVYSDFDYEKFASKGKDYLKEKYGSEIAKAQQINSDLEAEIENAKNLINSNIKIVKNFTFEKLLEQVDKNSLCILYVNSKRFKNKPGFKGHFVLVYKVDSKYVYLHDPGLPPRAEYKISKPELESAWGETGSGYIITMHL